MLRGLEQPVPSGRRRRDAGSDDWSCRRMLRTRLGVFLEVPDRRRGGCGPLGLAPLASGKRSAGRPRLDAIPVEHPQQARVSMSNHDQTKVRRTQAGRGHAGRDATAHASPAASKPSRLLRATHQAPRGATRPACDETVTDRGGCAQNQKRRCVRSWRSAGTCRERGYVLCDELRPALADATGRSLFLRSAMIERATVTAPEMIGLLVWWIVILAAPVILVRRWRRRRSSGGPTASAGRATGGGTAGRPAGPAAVRSGHIGDEGHLPGHAARSRVFPPKRSNRSAGSSISSADSSSRRRSSGPGSRSCPRLGGGSSPTRSPASGATRL